MLTGIHLFQNINLNEVLQYDLKKHDNAWSSIVIIISFFSDVSKSFVHVSVAYQFDCLFTKSFENKAIFVLFFKTKKSGPLENIWPNLRSLLHKETPKFVVIFMAPKTAILEGLLHIPLHLPTSCSFSSWRKETIWRCLLQLYISNSISS